MEVSLKNVESRIQSLDLHMQTILNKSEFQAKHRDAWGLKRKTLEN